MDGEPWSQPPTTLDIEFLNRVPLLQRKDTGQQHYVGDYSDKQLDFDAAPMPDDAELNNIAVPPPNEAREPDRPANDNAPATSAAAK